MELLRQPVEMVLCAAAAMGLLWAVGPLVLFWSPLRKLTTRAQSAPSGDVDIRDPEIAARVRELRARGFQPVARLLQQGWFFTPLHWRFVADPAPLLTSPDGRTFISVYRLGSHPVQTSAYTLFEGGGLASTVTGQAKYDGPLPDRYHRTEIAYDGPDDLITRHEQQVRALSETRGLQPRRAAPDDLATGLDVLTEPFVARRRFLAVYAVAAIGLIPLSPPTRHGRHLPAGALAGMVLASVTLFAIARVVALPEYRRPWKRLAVLLMMLVASAPVWLPLVLGRP